MQEQDVTPADVEALRAAAIAHHAAGRFEEALEALERLLPLEHQNPDVRFQIASVHLAMNQLPEAEQQSRAAIELDPEHARAWGVLGEALARLGNVDPAIGAYQKALQLAPSEVGPRVGLARLFHENRRFKEAAAEYDRATRLNPRSHRLWNIYGTLLAETHQPAKAGHALRSALAIDPTYAEAHSNLGLGLVRQGKVAAAVASYRRAMQLKPEAQGTHSNLLLALNMLHCTDENLLPEHRQWDERHASRFRSIQRQWTNDRSTGRRLRVGYISADFRRHPIAYFSYPFFSESDRHAFEVFCYSDVSRPDDMTATLRGLTDQWRDIKGLSDEVVAETIIADKIDILVDLSGHMGNNRLLVFARRAAPVQVTYLAYPNTTGISAMDYRITDADADPPGMTEAHHSETLIRLPQGFLCYRPAENAPAVRPVDTGDSRQVTFGCFNNFGKVTREMMGLWVRIVQSVPESKLLIKAEGLSHEQSRVDAAMLLAGYGLDESRIELMPRVPVYRDHLAAYHQMDIALDTLPYNGTTTTCEAVWMGVPVITLAGTSHRSRVGVSLLKRLGLDEFIAATPDQYVNIAAELGRDVSRRRLIAKELRTRMADSPVTKGAGFARHLEDAYRQMWQAWCQSA